MAYSLGRLNVNNTCSVCAPNVSGVVLTNSHPSDAISLSLSRSDLPSLSLRFHKLEASFLADTVAFFDTKTLISYFCISASSVFISANKPYHEKHSQGGYNQDQRKATVTND